MNDQLKSLTKRSRDAILRGRSPEQVLLVLDEPLVQDALAARLRSCGIRVSCASSAAEARARCRVRKVEVVFIDLPRSPPAEISRLSEALSRKQPNIVLLHAAISPSRAVLPSIQKPYSVASVAQTIRRLLDERQDMAMAAPRPWTCPELSECKPQGT